MKKWKVSSIVDDQTLVAKIKDEMMKQIARFKLLKAKKSSKLQRSTALSESIGENYLMMKFLQNATKDIENAEEEFLEICLELTEDQCPSSCDITTPIRRIDGCCNNINQRDNGRAPKPFARSLEPAYADGIDGGVPRGGFNPSSLPNPRSVSRAVHRPEQGVRSANVSLMVMQFGQFLDHDVTLTPELEADCCDENLREDSVCFNIDVSTDEFFEGKTDCLPLSRSEAICQEGPREQFNLITAFVDGSNVYGSDEETAEGLRTKTDGLLRTHELGPTLPTRQDAGFESDEHQNPQDLVAGDIRATETPGLAGIHSLFVAEHNRIARTLKTRDPELNDEDLYQISRRVVIGELQNIVFSEFLPVVLGEEEVAEFGLNLPDSGVTTYDPTVVADITNEFATAAFRFGHSLIPNSVLLALNPVRTNTISCPIKDTFFRFEEFVIGSDLSGKAWKNMVRGIVEQKSPMMDASINNAVLDFLYCEENCDVPGGFSEDLAARNIQRGREHGLQPYTKYRESCGLTGLTDWSARPEEISEEDWMNLKMAYPNVMDIDLFVGGLAEKSNDDGLVGPTFGCLIGRQFQKLMSGDRFFFTHISSGAQNEKGLPVRTKTSIRNHTLGDVICANTGATETPGRVMEISPANNAISCSDRVDLDFDAILEELSPILEEQTVIRRGYSYQYFQYNKQRFEFKVKAEYDAHIAFDSDEDDSDLYEIVIGGWGNSLSMVRRGKQGPNLGTGTVDKGSSPGQRGWTETPSILSLSEYRAFWITTENVNSKLEIKVGKIGETTPFMTGTDPTPLNIQKVGLSAFTDVATYKFRITNSN